MAGAPSRTELESLQTLFRVGSGAGLTDGQLLERFTSGPEEVASAAFAALVERHGATVRRVCRQILGDSHDADDAAQATFLILARRAASVRRRESVASWLFGVAVRVSRRARAEAARRRTHERRKGAMMAQGHHHQHG
ncbi:MAG TPA: sigma-70 family RNA polymerase sigma factor, partial [Isosphaeraceae bacterium]|nr:sigma-70 family RNA polymerase sigma factor [Isosphaeraceae bacterium]